MSDEESTGSSIPFKDKNDDPKNTTGEESDDEGKSDSEGEGEGNPEDDGLSVLKLERSR
jgi:hypothetical protein